MGEPMARAAYVNGQYLPHRSAAVNIENRGYRDPFGSGAPEPLYRRSREHSLARVAATA
jgi:hypothetical protein